MAWTSAVSATAALLAVAFTAGAQEAPEARIEWIANYHEGIAAAQEAEKPVLIDFYASWCGPCKLMDEQVFPDPAVVAAMAGFVCIKIDVDSDVKVALAYGVQSIPRTVVLNIHGEMVGDRIGFMESEAYIDFLKDAGSYARRKVDGTVIEVPADVPDTITIAPEAALDDVMKFLAAPEKKVREKAREALLALDPALVESWMRQALASAYLGDRIAARETLAKLDPEAWADFDPWAPEAERAKALAAVE